MSGNGLKKKARDLPIDHASRYAQIQKLIIDGFFDSPQSSEEVVHRIRERFGKIWTTSQVQVYMRRFMDEEIIHAVKPRGQRINYGVLLSVSREQALRTLGKTKAIQELERQLFSEDLSERLKRDFTRELTELEDNFGRNGNCTAFLLRKIPEKLIIVAFGKNQKDALLEDKNRPGGWVGLKQMIEIAAREKLNGVPFLTTKTANATQGIKFLGDTAAHNPLVAVDMATIVPQMPYIITAFEELAQRL